MKIKTHISLLLLILSFTVSKAQPPVICNDPPRMTSFCEDACIICDIDGYTGRHNSNVTGWLPPDFCTSIVHNAQWIAFIAGSENLKIELSVSNCTSSQGWGLEMTIYESRDCKTFQKVFDCDGDVEENTQRIFSNRQPLIIGQYYYLAMDGNGGDNCDWTLRVLEGTTAVSPLENSGELSIPDVVCTNTEFDLLLNPPVGATEFYWNINGSPLSVNAPSLTHQFGQNGEYNVCVSAANACDNAAPVCKTIKAVSTPPETYEKRLCGTDCFILPDTTLCDAGLHQLKYISKDGCDSIINVFIESLPQPITNLKATICNGDTIFVDDLPFTTSNLFQVNIDRELCDSIVNLDLRVIECNIEGKATIINASCYEYEDGSIDFSINNGTPPFNYDVKDLTGMVLQSGIANTLNSNIKLNGFKAGTYLIEIYDDFGNTEVIINEVKQPTPLINTATFSQYNNYNVSCSDANDGSIQLFALGGSPDYTYLWSNGDSTSIVNSLSAGKYNVSIEDANGCLLIQEYELTSPEVLNFEILSTDPECYVPNTGSIKILNQSGGVKPYSYSLVNKEFQLKESFEQLTSGEYNVYIKDENNCIISKTITLVDPEVPEIIMPIEVTIELGDSIDLEAISNLTEHNTIQWSGSYSYSCDTCLTTYYTPYKDSYAVLRLVSNDNCEDIDSVFLKVINKKHVYTPNIFNINSTINNEFTLVLGKGVKDIVLFNVYDRWGNLVYKENNTTPVNHRGWDGKLNGKECEMAVYVWMAEIRYLDDVIDLFKGDITLIK